MHVLIGEKMNQCDENIIVLTKEQVSLISDNSLIDVTEAFYELTGERSRHRISFRVEFHILNKCCIESDDKIWQSIIRDIENRAKEKGIKYQAARHRISKAKYPRKWLLETMKKIFKEYQAEMYDKALTFLNNEVSNKEDN